MDLLCDYRTNVSLGAASSQDGTRASPTTTPPSRPPLCDIPEILMLPTSAPPLSSRLKGARSRRVRAPVPAGGLAGA